MSDKLPKEIPFIYPPELESTMEWLAKIRHDIAEVTGIYQKNLAMLPDWDSSTRQRLHEEFRLSQGDLRQEEQSLIEKLAAYWAAQPITTVVPIDDD